MTSLLKHLRSYFLGSSRHRVATLYKLARWTKKKKLQRLSNYIFFKLEKEHGTFIHTNARIAENIIFPHPTGIVIGAGVVIESNVTIYQQVTLGGAKSGDYKDNNYPHIGQNTTIYAGAKIIGKIKIGKNCIIGANAVVTKDVPDDHVAAGVPAKSRPL